MDSPKETSKPYPWCNDEVQALLCIIGDGNIQRQLDGATRNERVFAEVAERMTSRGFYRTSRQCREKLKKLKSNYKSIKDLNGQSGSTRKPWRWFKIMDAIYGSRPPSCGRDSGLDSAISLLEDVICDGSLSSNAGADNGTETTPEPSGHSESEHSSPSTPTPPEAPSAPEPPNVRRRPGKRRRADTAELDHEEEVNRQQRERHHNSWMKHLQEETALRGEETALRREEIKQTTEFHQAFLGVMGQMVSVLRDGPPGPSTLEQSPPTSSTPLDTPPTPEPSNPRRRSGKRIRADTAELDHEEEENRQQRERHHKSWMKHLQEETALRGEETALRREEIKQTTEFHQAFLRVMGDMVSALRDRQV